jgi:2',3'-cyclic-nucleotide 2'-phosphodiesterase (5'-nucleotidase family)
MIRDRALALLVRLLIALATVAAPARPALSGVREVTLLFTNDFESAFDPIPAGNHEFEYGWQVFREARVWAPFPVLSANIFYAGTDIPFVPPYTVLERDGFRVGVIGVIGLDAATALVPSHVRGLEFRDPLAAVRAAAEKLRPDVDLVVVLAHQGWTAPMQTDAEARPEVQRDVAADLRLAGQVPGIDVLLGGPADAGTERPAVSPRTGTLVMQAYGHGTRLGRLRLSVDTEARRVRASSGELLLVDSDKLPPDPRVAAQAGPLLGPPLRAGRGDRPRHPPPGARLRARVRPREPHPGRAARAHRAPVALMPPGPCAAICRPDP